MEKLKPTWIYRENYRIRTNDLLSQVRIPWINWESPNLSLLISGGYSVVYQVVPGLIAKVGLIEQEEAERQRYLAEKGFALPVLDYEENVATSKHVRQAVCSEHGMRLVVPNVCSCHTPVNVLLMPEAVGIIAVKGFSEKKITAFMDRVAEICEKQLGLMWDYKEDNVAVYGGRLVALDFGDPNREDW